MKLRFLDQPMSTDNPKPSSDCYACHNGCCGINNKKMGAENQEEIDALLDSVINPRNFSF